MMSDDHLTSEEECPDCSGFDRCDFHEGVRRGRQQIKNGESVELDDCENCGSGRLKEFKYREGYGCWDCGYTSDEDASRMACSDCDSLVEDGGCLCGKTRTETSEKSEKVEGDRKTGSDSSNAVEELEPASWMTYQAAGGPGKVPYLTKIRAERANNTEDGYPKPFFTADQILDLMYENPNLAVLREKLEEFTQNDREDIVECNECGMRQYHENWDGECLDCGATIGQKPVKRRCTECGNEQDWPETPDSFTPECGECGGYMEEVGQKTEDDTN